MAFSIELIAKADAFEGLRPEWNELVERMACPEIFYSWEWNFHMLRRFRPDDELFVILVRDTSKTIVGIAPFCIRRTRAFGYTVKVVETIVTGLGDYCNIMIRNEDHRGKAVSAILEFLQTNIDLWDVVDISELCSRDSTTIHLLYGAQRHPAWSVRAHVGTPVAVLDFKSNRIAKDEKQIRQIRNRLKTLESRGFKIRIGCDDFGESWPAFCELHRKAWPASPFWDVRGQSFFDDLRLSPGLKGKLEFSIVEFNGRPVAMHFGFVDARKVYFYMPAMDREFRKDRVGSVLLYAMIEHYAKTHAAFDFLRGLEGYKLWYTDELDANFRLVIYRSANLAAFAYNLGGVTRRYAVELGLPKAVAQFARSCLARIGSRK